MDDIRIQPIEHITQSPGETEKEITIRGLDRERFWMLEVGTMYPYGLNDLLQHVGNVSHSSSRNNVFNLFYRHQRRKRSHEHRSNSSHTSEITLDLLRNLYNGGQGHGNLHRLLTALHSARLPNLHKLFTECEQLIVANHEQRFRSIVLDACCKRLFFPARTGTNSPGKPLRCFIKVFFRNKGIDKVKLTAILHNKLVRAKVPIYLQEQDPPLVSYMYTNNIFLGLCSIIIRPFVILILMIIVMRLRRVTANLHPFEIRYEPHGHVITGDLRIVRNRTLRRLLEKGPKYREQNIIDWHLKKKILITAIDD